MVSSIRAELIAVDEPSGDSFANENPPDSRRAGSRKHLLRFHSCLRSAILAARHAASDSLRIVPAVRSVVIAISLVPSLVPWGLSELFGLVSEHLSLRLTNSF
jgi:hypothetical protein